MKNEKEIWLDQVELKQLLEGGLYWKDIETKLSAGDTEGFKRHAMKEDVSIDAIIWEPCLNKNHHEILKEEPQTESDQIRAILLGEENPEEQKSNLEQESNLDQEVIKDRLINLDYLKEDYLQEEIDLASFPHAATEEDSEVKYEEKDVFSTRDVKDQLEINSREDKHFDDDDDFITELENKGTPFGGLKLIVLLIVSATVTFGVWYYFLNL